MDCALKTAKNESIAGFWAGLPTYIVRIAPHVMIVSDFIVSVHVLTLYYLDIDCIRALEEVIKVRRLNNEVCLTINYYYVKLNFS